MRVSGGWIAREHPNGTQNHPQDLEGEYPSHCYVGMLFLFHHGHLDDWRTRVKPENVTIFQELVAKVRVEKKIFRAWAPEEKPKK